ncbi:penicillin-binding protein 2 [Candidatus Saccharibacteria bacterium TM7i]|nr:penicillin-binding protein 2 [Candidatus Saccharibacteria bacterium TM7i]
MKPELVKGSRSNILARLVLIIAVVFALRLFYLQIIKHDHYVAQAQQEQVKRERLPATRGEIYAMSGDTPVKLVMNETVYTVFVDPAVIKDADKVIDVMKSVAGGNVRKDFEDMVKKKESRYQVIAYRLTRTQADKIKEKKLTGVGFQAVSQRVYPEGRLASQVLGFVNAEGAGNYGVEGFLNKQLAGKDGRLETVTDVSDVPLTVGGRNIREPAKNGDNLVLSIDRTIQSKIEDVARERAKKLGTDQLSIVVMNPNNGKVMGMANYPDFNPAEYYKVTDGNLFNNAAIAKNYEPGSTIKTFTMATAIDKGVARASDTFYNTDRIQVDDAKIENATKGKTGTITFQTAMNWSLNTGFVTLGQRLGNGSNITKTARDTMYDYFHNRFHLGQASGVELAAEAAGGIVSPDKQEGNEVRYANMTFGQGMDATALQVAAGFCAVVNGGNYYKPTVVNGVVEDGAYKANAEPQPVQKGVISADTSAQLRDMTQKARASAFSHVDKPGYTIGGKTGTSQVPKAGGYSDSETIASYVGFGGAEKPEYVIMVSMYGEGKVLQGAQHALPVFTEISNWMLDYLKIQPKG